MAFGGNRDTQRKGLDGDSTTMQMVFGKSHVNGFGYMNECNGSRFLMRNGSCTTYHIILEDTQFFY
jgi:hypothetical protein